MSQPRIVIGAREITTILIAGAVLIGSAAVFVLALNRIPNNQLKAQAPITPEAAAPYFVTATPFNPTPTPDPLLATPEDDGPLTHTVTEGESAASIANLYGVNLFDLLTANDLTEDSIIVAGQRLIIPDGEGGTQATFHEVRFGETLTAIANAYGVQPQAILDANNLTDPDAIIAGQRLRIPGVQGPLEQPTGTPLPLPEEVEGPWLPDWPRSPLAGDVQSAYPLLVEHPRFNLHYQPGTYVEAHLDEVQFALESALITAEDTLGVTMTERFDIYAAGTLFEAPNAHLRGLSGRSLDLFLLIDGSGDEADNAYLYTHEMTHMVARNTWGLHTSIMLSEGLATWVGAQAFEATPYATLGEVCQAAYDAGALPAIPAIERDWQQFQGHIRHRFNYFAAGCFIGWLADEYGLSDLRELYTSSAYGRIYGQSLASLAADWTTTLEANSGQPDEDLLPLTEELAAAYALVLPLYDGLPAAHRAYTALDEARLALWQGDYDAARTWLEEIEGLPNAPQP